MVKLFVFLFILMNVADVYEQATTLLNNYSLKLEKCDGAISEYF